MYMTLLRSIVLFGSETWALRKGDKQRLELFESNVFRKINEPVFDSETN